MDMMSGLGPDGGSIINLSSIVGSHPVAGVLLYASTKGAIETLTRGLALELAPRKIRVNAIAPLAVFLASDESAWITGEVIRAAGGLVAT